ncbi:CS1-pili formation C-terminal domain-containing protein [Vibrio coralliirubri]|uniref:CS1-pili formation C-terminal domain-containing protein n=1 Tax=Vibrio coralliirubri TaxID=1516159 RepID=UPI00063195D5|nr:TcfC E-set like domain-containing protein [Vibrio coralliirubri]CDT20112.1 conserved exported hypothetical protein [Vibrio coralliirubri]CDT38733.1 conserved exported hypothetical protein [Vibrio coralliirubri]CDT78985.1 conserved exported hypothetical protein [Vibrio coralliirubri]CDT81927.1 conserved exported hypothetical protein [Vibrio coralliirubri]CDU13267.1 conserved exported hypothetical protein [Vibrio coralliirubri]
MNKIIIGLLLMAMSSVVFSSNRKYPSGFESLFELETSELKVRNLDGTLTNSISFMTKFDTVQLNSSNEQAIREVYDFLESNAISIEHRDEMVDSLVIGVKDSSLCIGKLSECELITDTFHWVMNYNDKQLYLFVHPTLLDYNSHHEEQVYNNPKSESNGVINSFDLYVNQYSEQDSSIAFNDVVTVGLPYGYLKSDFSLNNIDDNTLYEAAYHLDLDNYAINVGYFEYNQNINSTKFLDGVTHMPQKSITLASSERLVIGGKNSDQLISFYAPVSGSVKIYRDERVIYQKNIHEGQNKVFYNELPMGRYEVKLDVISSGNVLQSYIYQVYNSAQDTLALGKIDYLISAGVLSDSYHESMSNSNSIEDDIFGKVLITHRSTPSLLLGVGSTFTDDNQSISTGITYHWMKTDITLDTVYTLFNDADHFNIDLGLKRFNISYETLNDSYDDALAKYMYGPSDYSRLSVSSSYSFGSGRSMYAVYNKTRQENDFERNVLGYESNRMTYQTISLGYSSPFYLDSRLDINLDYSDVDDEVSINLLWNIPLSKTVDLISGVTYSESDITQISTSIRKDHLIKSSLFDSSLELRNFYRREIGNVDSNMYQQALLNVAGDSRYGRADASIYTSSDAQRGITMSVSSTQILTGEDIYFSDVKSSSYLLIDANRVNELEDNIERGSFSLKKDNKQDKKFMIYKDNILVPIQEYYQYQAYFDAESVELFNSGDSYSSFFSHPGTVEKLKTKISRVVSFVSSFKDIDDEPIKDISCDGVGCLRINEIVDGVFRVTVLEGAIFELSSMSGNLKQRCLLPYEFSSTGLMNFGSNYCLPMDSTNENMLVNISGEVLNVRFIGVYEDHPDVNRNLKNFEELGYVIISKNIGRLKAIYVAQNKEKLDEMHVKHKKLFDELRVLAKRNYATDVINYPIAKSNEVMK